MTQPQSPLDLGGLRELLGHASPAPWQFDEDIKHSVQGGEPVEHSLGWSVYFYPSDPEYVEACGGAPDAVIIAERISREDAALIVAMRNSLPQLLARVQQLEEALKPFAVRFAQLDEAKILTARINSNGATQARFFVGDFHRARAALRAKLSDPSPEAGGSNDAD